MPMANGVGFPWAFIDMSDFSGYEWKTTVIKCTINLYAMWMRDR